MKKIRNELCKHRWSVRVITTFSLIMVTAVTVHTLITKGTSHYLTNWEGIVILGTYTLFFVLTVAARTIIRFNEWQFRMWFNCEPPAWSQLEATEVLKPLVDSCLTTLAASFDALDDIYTKLHSESLLEGEKSTPAGKGRARKFKELSTAMWSKREGAQTQFKVVRDLAITFGFNVPQMQDYMDQIRASEQAQAVLAKPEETASPDA